MRTEEEIGFESLMVAICGAALLACLVVCLAVRAFALNAVEETTVCYPDPVCERCGRVLDGTCAACFEEGAGDGQSKDCP